jgi:EmrB/QacA subfamily drug resistance transporter
MRRWLAMTAAIFAVLVVALDLTVLNVALPTLAMRLHAGTEDLELISAAYLVVFAALLLPAGLMGDRYGRRRMLLIGTVLFGLASLLAAYSGSVGGLVAARALMGIGGAIIMPLSTSIIPSLFSETERSRAIAITSGAMAAGLPLGPILGGYLLDHFWWGSVFLINVPVCAVATVLIALFLPESRDPEGTVLDLPGTVMSVVGLSALIYGVVRVSTRSWGDPTVVVPVMAGLLLVGLLVLRQVRSARPMMDLGLFRNRLFLWGTLTATFGSLVMAGGLFMIPQYLQEVLGSDTMGTGLRLTPMMLGLMAGGLVSAPVVARIGIKLTMMCGLGLFAAGFVLASATGAHDGYGFAAAWLSVIGVATGVTLVPAMDVMLGTLPENQTGVGSGLLQTLRQTGGALGTAGLGSMLASLYSGHLPAHTPAAVRRSAAAAGALHDPALLHAARSAFVFGMDRVMLVCAGGSVVVLLLVAVFLPGRAEGRDAEVKADVADSPHDHVTA